MIARRQYEAGEVILRENEPGETAYIIETGQVEVTKEQNGVRVHLAYIGPGKSFGEMSMIDDKPRSATVTAVEATVVREIHRDMFFESLRTHPDFAIDLLKALFERLREAQSIILQLRQTHPTAVSVPDAISHPDSTQVRTKVYLEGLTPEASRALPVTPFEISTFPFRIGRLSEDPLVHNDLMLPDTPPWQISRHHACFVQYHGRMGVVDRGSTLGLSVDGQRLGGAEGNPGPLFFSSREGTLILGHHTSPFQFRVTIVPCGDR